MKITTIGLDIAKNVFHAMCCNHKGKIVKKKKLRRSQVLAYFAQLPASLIGMEACGSAYYWARELQALGHTVRLIPAQHVKAFLRGNKNDYNDALAISFSAKENLSGGKATITFLFGNNLKMVFTGLVRSLSAEIKMEVSNLSSYASLNISTAMLTSVIFSFGTDSILPHFLQVLGFDK